jgi:hypothetical protein
MKLWFVFDVCDATKMLYSHVTCFVSTVPVFYVKTAVECMYEYKQCFGQLAVARLQFHIIRTQYTKCRLCRACWG